MPDQMLSIKELKAHHSEVTPQLMQGRKHCPLLGRAIKFDATKGRIILYSLNDVADIFLHRRTEPLAEMFEDNAGRWIWMQLLNQDARRLFKWKSPVYKISADSCRRWANGCPALGGAKLQIRTEYTWPIGGGWAGRDYVRTQDLDKIAAFKLTSFDLADHPGWMTRDQALEYTSDPTLNIYSDSTYRGRTPGTPHPILGRCIKTKMINTASGGQPVQVILYWRADIEKLFAVTSHANYVGWEKARDNYHLQGGTLDAAVKSGKVRTKNIPVPPRQGTRAGSIIHYFEPDLLLEMNRINGGGPQADHTEILARIDNRVGRVEKTAETTLDTVTITDGKVDRLPATITLKQSDPTTRRRRGQPPASDVAVKADAILFRDYKSSCLEDTEFDREKGYQAGTTRLAVKRHRERQRRSTSNPNDTKSDTK